MNEIEQLSARIDRIEGRLDRILRLLEGAPQRPAAKAFNAAEAALAQVHGAQDVSQRLAETLVRIGEPETLDAITRIAILAPKLEYAAYAVSAGPELLEEAMETAQHMTANFGLSDAAIKQRIAHATDMLTDLSRPESIQTVQRLGRLAPHLAPTASAAAQAAQQLAAHEGETQLSERLAETLIRIGEPETLDALTRIAILAPKLEYAAYAVSAGPELLEEALEIARETLDQTDITNQVMQRRLSRASAALLSLSDEDSIDALANAAAAIPVVSPMIDAATNAAQALTEVEGRDALRERLTETLIRVGEPETLDSLTRIAMLAPKLEYAAYAASAGPELLEEALEVAREQMGRTELNSQVIQRRLERATEAVLALSTEDSIDALANAAAAIPTLSPMITAATDAGQALAEHEGRDVLRERLTETLIRVGEPETLEALTRIAILAPKLEYAAYAASAGPELLEEALEMVREWSAHQDGPSADQRAYAALDALGALSEPSVLRGLADLSRALPTLSRPESVAALERVGGALPELSDSLDLALQSAKMLRTATADIGGVEALTEPATAGLKLLHQAAKPEVLEALEHIVALAPVLASFVEPLANSIKDVDPAELAEFLTLAARPETLRSLSALLRVAPEIMPALDALPTQPQTLELLKAANRAVAAAAKERSPAVGAFGLLSALRDPQIQQVVGFGVNLSRYLGAELQSPPQIENK